MKQTILILFLAIQFSFSQRIELPDTTKIPIVKNPIDSTKIQIDKRLPNEKVKFISGSAVIKDRKPIGLVEKKLEGDENGVLEFDLVFYPIDTVYERAGNLIFETITLENSQGYRIEERKEPYEVEKIDKPINKQQ